MEEKTKLLNPKLDIVFQALFGEEGSERITKAFLEKILNIEIDEIELNQNPILRRNRKDDKLGVLDVIAKINNNQNVDIEMQIAKKDNIRDRILYYWSRLYIRSIKKKQDYETLEKSIVILIADEKIKGLEELECHTQWKITECKNKTLILTDKLEIHIIELEKLSRDMDSISIELLDWLSFLQDPESERVMKSMEKNSELKEAKEKLEEISNDGQMQQLAWWREKGIYEENERKRKEKENRELEKRIKEDKARLQEDKARLQEGEARLQEDKARLEKRAQEIKAQSKENMKDVAIKLLQKGLNIEDIIEITKLKKEEIENIKNCQMKPGTN